MYIILSAKLIQVENKWEINTRDLVGIWKAYYKRLPVEGARKIK
jgi:hypothetical protein